MTMLRRLARHPALLLLLPALLIGLFTFRDYGYSWDEPLFYKYAEALGYAYTPANWFSGHFDLNQSYGPSADDHKNRGPAYLLLGREPAHLIEELNIDTAAAWHLVNFVTFLLGVYFLYRICERFVRPPAALAASALFLLQPLLWGHAFINPKDPPFLVFLTGSVFLGFRMVDRLSGPEVEPARRTLLRILLPAVFLGITTSIRVLGPLAGLLVVIYFLAQRPPRRTLGWILLYAALAIAVMLATWPYLWESPARFLQAFQFMSDNPTVLPVLFGDQVYRAYELPRRYLPFYLFFTLTEFVWPLFVAGLIAAYLKLRTDFNRLVQAALLLAWFAIPFAYVELRNPPDFDGMRHFLFMLPPVFIFAGFGFDLLIEKVSRYRVQAALIVLLLAPGVLGIVELHPYEYAYYNAFIGGTGGAYRHYETEYWLTCYKEAVEGLEGRLAQPATLYVHREAYIAATYAGDRLTVLDERGHENQIRPGDYILVNTRTNEDRKTFREAPTVLSVERAGATFCVVRQVP
jgi:hypothetical protein